MNLRMNLLKKQKEEKERKIVNATLKSQEDFIRWARNEKNVTKEEFCDRIKEIKPIPSCEDSEFSRNVQILFHAILNCPYLDSQTQGELISELLNNKGYKNYYSELFNETDPEKVLMAVNYWMKTINKPLDIIKIFEATKDAVSYQNFSSTYIESFMRIAQLRILEIFKDGVIQDRNLGKTREEIKHSYQVISAFLQDTQPMLFSHFRKHYSSYDIFEMICSSKQDAVEKFNDKCRSSNDQINHKLTNKLKHVTHFNFFVDKQPAITKSGVEELLTSDLVENWRRV